MSDSAGIDQDITAKVTEMMNLLGQYACGTEKGDVIRWALTYFFDRDDMIGDNLPVLGLIDDKMVVDMALT